MANPRVSSVATTARPTPKARPQSMFIPNRTSTISPSNQANTSKPRSSSIIHRKSTTLSIRPKPTTTSTVTIPSKFAQSTTTLPSITNINNSTGLKSTKGKAVYGRAALVRDEQERQKKEKEQATKKARAQAAEWGRNASREWAAKMKGREKGGKVDGKVVETEGIKVEEKMDEVKVVEMMSV